MCRTAMKFSEVKDYMEIDREKREKCVDTKRIQCRHERCSHEDYPESVNIHEFYLCEQRLVMCPAYKCPYIGTFQHIRDVHYMDNHLSDTHLFPHNDYRKALFVRFEELRSQTRIDNLLSEQQIKDLGGVGAYTKIGQPEVPIEVTIGRMQPPRRGPAQYRLLSARTIQSVQDTATKDIKQLVDVLPPRDPSHIRAKALLEEATPYARYFKEDSGFLELLVGGVVNHPDLRNYRVKEESGQLRVVIRPSVLPILQQLFIPTTPPLLSNEEINNIILRGNLLPATTHVMQPSTTTVSTYIIFFIDQSYATYLIVSLPVFRLLDRIRFLQLLQLQHLQASSTLICQEMLICWA
jgi:hypothetical protein